MKLCDQLCLICREKQDNMMIWGAIHDTSGYFTNRHYSELDHCILKGLCGVWGGWKCPVSVPSVPKMFIWESECFSVVHSDIVFWALIECIAEMFQFCFPAFHFPVVSTAVTDHWFDTPIRGMAILLPFRLTENTSLCHFYYKTVQFHQALSVHVVGFF